MKRWGRVLNRIQVDGSARIVWSAVSREDLSEMDAKSKETHGILDELISTIPDADVYVLFTELEEGGLKASMRSNATIDVNKLAGRSFCGGGHARASGFRVASFDNFQLQVLECIQKLKEGMTEQRKEEETTPAALVPEPKAALPVSEPVKKESAPIKPQERDIVEDITK